MKNATQFVKDVQLVTSTRSPRFERVENEFAGDRSRAGNAARALAEVKVTTEPLAGALNDGMVLAARERLRDRSAIELIDLVRELRNSGGVPFKL